MLKGIKIISVLLIIALCINFIPFTGLNSSIQAQAGWVKNTGNPLATGTGSINGEASVIYDSAAGLYKMWYTEGAASYSSLDTFISFILSNAGTALVADMKASNFANIANNDSAGVKAVVNYIAGLSAAQLQTYLQGASPTIGYATSPDGITWTVQTGGVSGNTGTWDAYGVSAPSVIQNSATSYEMWYTGWNIDAAAVKQLFVDINTLTAPQMQTLLTDFFVTKNPGQMFSDVKTIAGSDYPHTILQDMKNILVNSGGSIGYATSTDGAVWTSSGAVLSRGAADAWDNYGVSSPSVVKTASGYKMWYTGLTIDFTPFTNLVNSGVASFTDLKNAISNAVKSQIGLATLSGSTWTKEAANPVLSRNFSAGSGPLPGVAAPSVMVDSTGTYQMWYTDIQADPGKLLDFLQSNMTFNTAVTNSANISIWKAASTNGISWTSPTLAFSKGTESAWDNQGVGAPGVIQVGNNLKMWYTGITYNAQSLLDNILDNTGVSTALSNSSSKAAIGLATYALPITPTPTPPAGGDGGGGGGGGVVIIPGLTSDIPLKIDSSGMVMADTKITTRDGNLTFDIPAGTRMLNADGTPLTQLTADPMPGAIIPPPPSGNAIIAAYFFGPNGATFEPPITITFKYDPAKLPAGVTEDKLVIAWWDGSKWVQLKSTVDAANNTISVQVAHFTIFAIMGSGATPKPPVVTPPVTTQPTPPVVTPPSSTTPTKPVVTPPVTTTPAKPAPEPAFSWWIIVVIVVVVALIIAGVFWRLRTRKQQL